MLSFLLKTINLVLEKATKEKFQAESSDELVGNIWVLIQTPGQQTFSKPTEPPVVDFEKGFLGWSAEQLQDLVQAKFSPDGLGHESSGHTDCLADDAFAIVDQRTAKDNTVAFFAQELVDPVNEAEVRVAWRKSTERDEALVRFANGDELKEDVRYLVEDVRGESASDLNIEEARERLQDWFEQEKEDSKVIWFEFRLSLDSAIQNIHGIFQRGAFDSLLNREEDFDEDGVMVG